VATTIDARERDVQHAFDQALAIARGATTRSLHELETSLWTALLALGRAMIALYLARVVARPRAAGYVHAVGAEARPFLESAPAPEDDGEILVIQVDGGGAPHIDLAELLLRRRPHVRGDGTGRHRQRRRRRARVRPRRNMSDCAF
jgi:hypothetical protein